MAKKKGTQAKIAANKLPYVQTAVFCDQILEDKDRVLSAIRIFDNLYVPAPPLTMPGIVDIKAGVIVKVLLMMKSGSVRGKRKIRIVSRGLNGETGPVAEVKAVFEGREHGVNIQAQIEIPIVGEGLYWCDVLVGEDLITRMPLRIHYTKPPEPSSEAKTQA